MNPINKSGLKVFLLLAFAFIIGLMLLLPSIYSLKEIEEYPVNEAILVENDSIYITEIVLEEPKVIINETELKLNEILEIAAINAGSHEYKLHVYDCTQFSEKLVRELKNKGYRAQCTAGNNWNNDYTNHTWVSVWVNNVRYEIEATNGNWIEQWEFDERQYTKWKENYCW